MPEAHAVPKQQSQATQASRIKKIEAYAAHLISEATAKEKVGRTGDAMVDYLQAADLLLLVAKGTQDYTPWKAYTDRAIACQKRVRILIAQRKLDEEKEERAPMAPAVTAPAASSAPASAPLTVPGRPGNPAVSSSISQDKV